MPRPELNKDINPDIFDSHYWYKNELTSFAKMLGVSASGGKFEIHDRISEFLRTGNKIKPKNSNFSKQNIDWQNDDLSPETIIDSGYNNNQYARAFFKSHIKGFSFNIDFMNFMKKAQGQTLGDAVDFYLDLQARKKKGYKQAIPDHNQYNAYVRDFLSDNPDFDKKQVLRYWLAKIEIPIPGSKGRGFVYDKSDLNLV